MIKACGNEEVKKAVFEAVTGGETDESLEFLKVCCPMHLFALQITGKMLTLQLD